MRPLRFGTRTVPADRAVVMAIVNRTPDSFYDRGATFQDEPALARVERAVADGAAIIDIGGVKAGPGEEVTAEEEARRRANVEAAAAEAERLRNEPGHHGREHL